MKQLPITLTIIVLLASESNSQQIMVESGKSITSFDFNDAQSVALDNMQSTSQSYISFGYRKKIVKEILYVIAGAGVNSYGAIGSDVSQNFYEWQTTYLGIYTGLDVRLIKFNNIEFYFRAMVSPEFILQGTQTLNNQVFNIVGAEDFDKANLFVRAGLIFEYSLTYSMSLFVLYKYGKSTQLTKPSIDNNQGRLQFQAHDIGFGLVISLDPKKARKFRNKVKKGNRIKS